MLPPLSDLTLFYGTPYWTLRPPTCYSQDRFCFVKKQNNLPLGHPWIRNMEWLQLRMRQEFINKQQLPYLSSQGAL
jgi:hypothetical protein